jgi:hypothetical protein
VRGEYGAAGVFDLAEELWVLVPRRPSVDTARPNPWLRPTGSHLVRGAVHVLPAAIYLAAVQFANPAPRDVLLLLLTGLVAAGVGQVLSVLDHLLTGRLQHVAAGRLVRRVLGAASLVLALLVALAPHLGVTRQVALLAAGFVLYHLSATAIIVAGAHRLLLALLVPLSATAVAVMLGRPSPASLPPWAVPAAAVIATVVAALITHRPRRGDRDPGAFSEWLTREELTFAAASGWYGLGVAAVLPVVLLDVALGRSVTGFLLVSMVPVLATTVLSDWCVHRLRGGAVTALAECTHTSQFMERAWALLRTTSLAYGAVGLVAGGVALGIAAIVEPGSITLQIVLDTLAYAATAVCLLQATLLVSMSLPVLAATAMTAMAAGDGLLRAVFMGVQAPLLEGGRFIVAVVTAALLMTAAGADYTTPSAHR